MAEEWVQEAKSEIAGALGIDLGDFDSLPLSEVREQLLERQAEKQSDYDSAEGRVNKRAASRHLKAINEIVEASEKWFSYQELESTLEDVLNLLDSGNQIRARLTLQVQKDAAEAAGGGILERFKALEQELILLDQKVQIEKERAEQEIREREALAEKLAAEKAKQTLEQAEVIELEEPETKEVAQGSTFGDNEDEDEPEQAEHSSIESSAEENLQPSEADSTVKESSPSSTSTVPEEVCDRFTFIISKPDRLHVVADDGALDLITFGRYRSQYRPDLPIMNAVPKNKEETMRVIRMISGRHGSLNRRDDIWYLDDNWEENGAPSTNGIFLDGERTLSIELRKCNGQIITFAAPDRQPGLPVFQVKVLDSAQAEGTSSILLERLDAFHDHILILSRSTTLPADMGGTRLERIGRSFAVEGQKVDQSNDSRIARWGGFEASDFEEIFYERG